MANAGSFKKGEPKVGQGKRGPNKTTAVLKDAILLAAKTVGQDGAGHLGLVGYLITLAKMEPKAFSSLLGRVLPLQVDGAGPNGEHVFQKIVVEVVKAK